MVQVVNRWFSVFIIVLITGQSQALFAAGGTSSEFPGRPLYPEVSVIELDDLFRRLDEVIVVDVRSSYEYGTLRVKGAVNIPLSSNTFVSRMRKLRMSDTRPIIV